MKVSRTPLLAFTSAPSPSNANVSISKHDVNLQHRFDSSSTARINSNWFKIEFVPSAGMVGQLQRLHVRYTQNLHNSEMQIPAKPCSKQHNGAIGSYASFALTTAIGSDRYAHLHSSPSPATRLCCCFCVVCLCLRAIKCHWIMRSYINCTLA